METMKSLTIIVWSLLLYSCSIHEDIQPTVPVPASSSGKLDTIYRRTLQWDYNGFPYSVTVHFPGYIYSYYKNLPKDLSPERYACQDPHYPYLVELVNALYAPIADKNLSDEELAKYFLAVCQSVPYTSDPDVQGDYPRFPIETIVENQADCEDVAAMLAGLVSTCSIRSIIMVFPTKAHQAVGIECENCPDYTYYLQGHTYMYAEATNKDFHLGEVPEDIIDVSKLTLLSVPQTATYNRPRVEETPVPLTRNHSYRRTPNGHVNI